MPDRHEWKWSRRAPETYYISFIMYWYWSVPDRHEWKWIRRVPKRILLVYYGLALACACRNESKWGSVAQKRILLLIGTDLCRRYELKWSSIAQKRILLLIGTDLCRRNELKWSSDAPKRTLLLRADMNGLRAVTLRKVFYYFWTRYCAIDTNG